MAFLTTQQVLLVGAIGGLAALLGAVVLRLALRGLSHLAERLLDRRDASRVRRKHLKTCRAIDALGTTNHPKE